MKTKHEARKESMNEDIRSMRHSEGKRNELKQFNKASKKIGKRKKIEF